MQAAQAEPEVQAAQAEREVQTEREATQTVNVVDREGQAWRR